MFEINTKNFPEPTPAVPDRPVIRPSLETMMGHMPADTMFGRVPVNERPADSFMGRVPANERPADSFMGRVPANERPADTFMGRVPANERPADTMMVRKPNNERRRPIMMRVKWVFQALYVQYLFKGTAHRWKKKHFFSSKKLNATKYYNPSEHSLEAICNLPVSQSVSQLESEKTSDATHLKRRKQWYLEEKKSL